MRLSIIIPVYNVAPFLEQCLDSLFVDNRFAGQVICVNDGSSDGSLEILNRYVEHYPNLLVVTQPNMGLSVARNTGLDHAKGDYVFFLDSDDWVMPDMIDCVLNRIDSEDVIYFNAKRYYEDSQSWDDDCPLPEVRDVLGSDYFTISRGQKRNMPIVCVCGGFYRRSFLFEHHLKNEPGIYHEDNYFTPQVLLVAKHVSFVDEYLYVYRIRKGSITAKVSQKHIKDLLFIARNLFDHYKLSPDVPRVFYSDVKDLYIQLIIDAYNNGIPLGKMWLNSDSKNLAQCADDTRSQKISTLCMISPKLAYNYIVDKLPSIIRRSINRFM